MDYNQEQFFRMQMDVPKMPFYMSYPMQDLYLTENAVYVDTELLGPGNAEKTESLVTCPYIVLKLEDPGLSVVFE